MPSDRVAIVGAGLSDCGRVPDKTAMALMAQSSRRAIADAGLAKDDIDGFGGHGTLLPPVEVSEYLGLRPSWVDATNVGGSSWEVMASHAATAIAAGEIEVALLTYGSTARSDVKRRARAPAAAISSGGAMQYEAPYGATLVAKYAMAARRHMIEYGTTTEQLAEVAVAAHEWAAMNDNAFERERITVADVAAAPMLAEPFTSKHVCLRTDGGGAVVLASERVAKNCAKEPIWILGAADATSHVSMSEWGDFTTSAAALSGPRAFAQAGVSPSDIDVCQLYDSFTSTVLLTVEDLGFCAKGEGGAFIESRALRPGGALPTNTDGGGLAACHPGMRGMFLLVEAVRQLRGECGPSQVNDARLACVHAMGGFFTHSATMILGEVAMTGPDRPTIDSDSESWWAAVQDRTLMVNACTSCGRNSLYARPFCPHCWSEDVALKPATGRARLYTWTVVHQNAAPFDTRTPYVVAMVDLEEGPRLMTILEDCPIQNLHSEMELAIAFRDSGGFLAPVFRPAARSVGKEEK